MGCRRWHGCKLPNQLDITENHRKFPSKIIFPRERQASAILAFFGYVTVSLKLFLEFVHFTQTSQDPSSPMAVIPSSSMPLSSSSLAAQRNSDIRDEWSWNDWGSLEEQPVCITIRIINTTRMLWNLQSIFGISYQIEEDRDESEEKEPSSTTTTNVTNSKFDGTADERFRAFDQNNRPNDLLSLSSKQIITSPINSNTNSNATWNTDTWADGEFEPLEEPSLGTFPLKMTGIHGWIEAIYQCFLFIQQEILNWTRHEENAKKKKFNVSENWKPDEMREVPWNWEQKKFKIKLRKKMFNEYYATVFFQLYDFLLNFNNCCIHEFFLSAKVKPTLKSHIGWWFPKTKKTGPLIGVRLYYSCIPSNHKRICDKIDFLNIQSEWNIDLSFSFVGITIIFVITASSKIKHDSRSFI